MAFSEKSRKEIDLRKFHESLREESDRGIVLITSSLLDICLTELFEKFLILDKKLKEDILDYSLAPLKTFSSKIKMAYALGLVDKQEYKNLEYIRKIRNKFAHKIQSASFKDQQIIDWCKQIEFTRVPEYDPANYRHLFYDAAYYLTGYLHARIDFIEKQKYTTRAKK